MDALYDAILGAVTLKQVQRARFEGRIEHHSERMSGAVDPSAIFVVSGKPRATFDAHDLSGVLTGISVSTGLAIAAGTITIPWNKRAQGGTFAGASANAILSGTDGLAVIHTISGSQGPELASVSIEIAFLATDGLTAPVTASVNTTLSAEAYGTSYAMGPMYIDGSQLLQVKSISVDTGIKVTDKSFDGAIYPQLLYIETRDPVITVTFEDFDALHSQAPLFASMTSAAAYFRKRVDGGTFVSDVTAGHVKLSLGTGLKVMEGAGASGNESGTATIKLMGKALSSSTATAIGG